ncbi:hypothetical protein, partial [Glutamicibacter arilaitensis]|uniref:hypothetical protein n=1 Tax=Glutamicibacter arilaitensis TaxID=256701 RepID=UPI003FD1A1BD
IKAPIISHAVGRKMRRNARRWVIGLLFSPSMFTKVIWIYQGDMGKYLNTYLNIAMGWCLRLLLGLLSWHLDCVRIRVFE